MSVETVQVLPKGSELVLGTALNLFLFDVLRLSVDIDLNDIGAVDREGMEAERPSLAQKDLKASGSGRGDGPRG